MLRLNIARMRAFMAVSQDTFEEYITQMSQATQEGGHNREEECLRERATERKCQDGNGDCREETFRGSKNDNDRDREWQRQCERG